MLRRQGPLMSCHISSCGAQEVQFGPEDFPMAGRKVKLGSKVNPVIVSTCKIDFTTAFDAHRCLQRHTVSRKT